MFIVLETVRLVVGGVSQSQDSLRVRTGQRVSILFPNGVSQAAFLRVLAALDAPRTGEVRLHPDARTSLLGDPVAPTGLTIVVPGAAEAKVRGITDVRDHDRKARLVAAMWDAGQLRLALSDCTTRMRSRVSLLLDRLHHRSGGSLADFGERAAGTRHLGLGSHE